MRRPGPGVGTELVPLALILIGLAGTLGLVVAMHRRSAARPAVVLVAAPAPPVGPAPPALPEPEPEPPSPRKTAPAVDPTATALTVFARRVAEQRQGAAAADRRAEALGAARRVAAADSERFRRRESLVRAEVERIADQAQGLEAKADALAAERDALAAERDASKDALRRARSQDGGYAVLPHKGLNGTWQRPVVIECKEGMAVLQPRGLGFTMLDMSPLLGPRGSPMVAAVGRELVRVAQATSPDGAPVIPYIYFIVRPDGIRPYYEARHQLEPLGIAFGYELVDQDWRIEFPDFDDLAAWDGSATARPKPPAAEAARDALAARDFVWPADRAAAGRRDAFLWPTSPPSASGDTGGPDPARGPDGGPGASRLAGVGRSGSGMGPGIDPGADHDGDAFRGGGGSVGSGLGGGGGSRVREGPAMLDLTPPTLAAGGSAFGASPRPATPAVSRWVPAASPNPAGGRGASRDLATGQPATDPPATAVGGDGTGGFGLPPGTAGAGGGPDGLGSVGRNVLPDFQRPGSPEPAGDDDRGTGKNARAGRAGIGDKTGDGAEAPPGARSGRSLTANASGGSTPPGGRRSGTGRDRGDGSAAGDGGPGPDAVGDPGLTFGVPGSNPTPGNGRGPNVGAGRPGGLAGTGDANPVQGSAAAGGGSTVSADGLGSPPTMTGVTELADPVVPGRTPIDPELLARAEDDELDGRPPFPAADGRGASPGRAAGPGRPGSPGGRSLGGASSPGSSGSPGSPGSGGPPPGLIGVGTPAAAGGEPGSTAARDSSQGGGDTAPALPTPASKPRRDVDPLKVDVPLDLDVACGPDGVVIHPGGYRLSPSALRKPGALAGDLNQIVRNREMVDVNIRPRPRVRFLVEAGGDDTFAEARRQTVLSNPGWPVSIRPAGPPAPRVFAKERF